MSASESRTESERVRANWRTGIASDQRPACPLDDMWLHTSRGTHTPYTYISTAGGVHMCRWISYHAHPTAAAQNTWAPARRNSASIGAPSRSDIPTNECMLSILRSRAQLSANSVTCRSVKVTNTVPFTAAFSMWSRDSDSAGPTLWQLALPNILRDGAKEKQDRIGCHEPRGNGIHIHSNSS